MTPFEVGWLCGLLEGDGTFTLDKFPSGRSYPRIAVRMTDRDTVERVAKLMETNLLGPYENNGNDGHKRRPVFVTYAQGPRALSLMKLVCPHMSKRRQARIKELVGRQVEMFEFPRAL